MMANLSSCEANGTLDNSFWCHIYNIGGGQTSRMSTYDMYKDIYGELGFIGIVRPVAFA